MNLGQLKSELLKQGIKAVGTGRESATGRVVVFFTSAKKVVFPFAPEGGIYPLQVKTGNDDDHVNVEKINALKRFRSSLRELR